MKLSLHDLALLVVVLCAQSTHAQELQEFTARYQVRYHGLNGGKLNLTLRKSGDDYLYESSADPSFLGSFMISDSAREVSTLLIDGDEVRPLRFVSDDGKKGDAKDSRLEFNWQDKRLTGRSERVNFDQELPARVQDHLSIQIAVIVALMRNAELGDFNLIDAGKIKAYTYSKEGNGEIKFRGQTFDAIVVRSERTGSPGSRTTRYWHVPQLGFLPVRAERTRDGNVDLTMDLVDFKPSLQ